MENADLAEIEIQLDGLGNFQKAKNAMEGQEDNSSTEV